jgi:hypothetical protein
MQQIYKSMDSLPRYQVKEQLQYLQKLRSFTLVFDCSLSLKDIVTSILSMQYVPDTTLSSHC